MNRTASKKRELSKRSTKPSTHRRIVTRNVNGRSVVQSDEPLLTYEFKTDISKVIVDLGKQFPLLQPHISNDISSQLLARLRLGELDGAVVVLPEESALTPDLDGVTLAQEEMQPVQARTLRQSRSARCVEFYQRNWILNPVGCLVREEIRKRVERMGVPLVVAAELHSPGLQLSLIAGNVGVGVLRTSFLRVHPLRTRLRVIEHPNFSVAIRIAFFRGRYLGTREQVVIELQRMLVNHFENGSA